jgi:hypothetical protein
VTPDSRIYTYKELYVRQTVAAEVARLVQEMSEGEEIDYTALARTCGLNGAMTRCGARVGGNLYAGGGAFG